jgi:hypothetical protein
MQLHRLIYQSIAADEVVSNALLRDLEAQAAMNNAAHDITGLLVLANNVFLQVLEGRAAELTALFGRIVRDPRHRAVTLLSFEPTAERSFDDWALRLIDLYDLPGDKRRLMTAKYRLADGSVVVPGEIHRVHALLLDARFLCLSAPWKAPGEGGSAARSA